MFYMQGYKIISKTLSSSVKIFLEFNYLQNKKNFQQESDIQTKTEQYTIQKNNIPQYL